MNSLLSSIRGSEKNKKLKELKLILNHCETAQDLLNHYTRKAIVDGVIVSEQNRGLDESSCELDGTGNTAT